MLIYVDTETETHVLQSCFDRKTKSIRLVNITKSEISPREFTETAEIVDMMDKLKQAGRIEEFRIVTSRVIENEKDNV